MKTTILSFTCMLLLLGVCAKAFPQSKDLISVKIEWEDFGTETIVDVNCDQFRSLFKESIQTKSLDNIESTFEIEGLLKYFIKEKLYKHIDVRGIITLNYKGNRIEYCFDQFGHFYKDGILLSNIPLMEFIKGIIFAKYSK